ncbi:hypothetical protein [Capnocytophaga leadbetteri]|uniref:hypothetical protein n=1 Tax=Capnocytophaga leadbetteri TaxID=327575 RepID=UPI0028E8620E|nr:hypothetical protein [Capnocytophaga leadbetteri]
MIKKILLLTIAAVSFAACSKSDKDTPVDNGNGSNDKLLGTWVGTYDIIAEKPEQQVRLVELLKTQHNLMERTFNINSEFKKTRAVFSNNNNGNYSFKYFDETGKIEYGGINYTIKENKMIDIETNVPVSTYSFEGNNKLTSEMLGYFLFTIDAEKSADELSAEIKKLNLDASKPTDIQKITELTSKIQQKNTLKYKLKWYLNRQ